MALTLPSLQQANLQVPNAKGDLCSYLAVKDSNLKPDILDPITDTLEAELGKLPNITMPDDPMLQALGQSVTERVTRLASKSCACGP